MRKSARRASQPARKKTTKSKDDELLRGRIIVLGSVSPRGFPNRGKTKPSKGAELTVRQLVPGSDFIGHTGVTAGNFINVPTTAGGPFQFTFALADMPQSSSFTALFDQYRIDQVEVHMIPNFNFIDGHNTASPNNLAPPTVVVLDYDDAGSLVSEAGALEYDNAQIIMPYERAVIKVRPKITPATYAGGVFEGYMVEDTGGWLDVASTTIDHYGVKGWVNPLSTSSTSTLGWYVYAMYTVSFANVR